MGVNFIFLKHHHKKKAIGVPLVIIFKTVRKKLKYCKKIRNLKIEFEIKKKIIMFPSSNLLYCLKE